MIEKDKEKIIPLRATVSSLSMTGNLIIVFNKPIIIPPILVSNSTESNSRLSQLNKAGDILFNIEDVIDISVASDFYVEHKAEINITNYVLKHISER